MPHDPRAIELRARRFPEFRAREVDGVPMHPCPVREYPCMVAQVAIADYHRGDWELASFARAHGALRKDWRNLMLSSLFAHAPSALVQRTVADEGGTNRTLNTRTGTDTSSQPWNEIAGANDQTKLKYGDSAAAVDETHHNLQGTNIFGITASSITYDDGNKKVTARGSRAHPEAAVTLRELGLFGKWTPHTGASVYFMLDRTVPASQNVNQDQSVTVEYVGQF